MDKQALELLNQIIDKAEEQDRHNKKLAIANHKACDAVAEGWMLFHLKCLKELLTKEK